ncbi:hypothetical protein FRB91_000062 [Serendipita sp. 411]|nr:hypothetical protein FRB91_000062 [Serendipita sp. 411]
MALTLLSLAVLATTVMAVPRPQLSPAASTSSASIIRCKAQIISQQDDTCRSIGLPWGLYDYQIFEANSFLNCEDIWVGTPICIPDVPLPSTVVCPTVTTVAPLPQVLSIRPLCAPRPQVLSILPLRPLWAPLPQVLSIRPLCAPRPQVLSILPLRPLCIPQPRLVSFLLLQRPPHLRLPASRSSLPNLGRPVTP